MMEAARFHFRLTTLQKQKRAVESDYEGGIKAARDRKDRDRENALIGELMFECDLIDDEIFKLSSRRVTRLAERYLIPIPEFSTDSNEWTESTVDGRYRLSDQAIAELMSKVGDGGFRRRGRLAFLHP